MQIVHMTEKWIPSVLLLEQACFSEPWSEAGLKEAVESPLYRYFVACEDDELLGYGGMFLAGDEANVTNIAVAPQLRKKGVGTEIVRALLAEAEKSGAERVFLEVRVGNEPARHLYERCGFVEVGIRKDFYRGPKEDGAVYMYEIKKAE